MVLPALHPGASAGEQQQEIVREKVYSRGQETVVNLHLASSGCFVACFGTAESLLVSCAIVINVCTHGVVALIIISRYQSFA